MILFRNLLIASTTLMTMGVVVARADDSVRQHAPQKQSANQYVIENKKSKAVVSLGDTGLPELISVSAARRPTSTDDIGTSMTIITEKQIQTQQRRSLTDILARQPGLNVVQTGGPGGTSSIFMRGNNSNEVKVRLDGMDINDGSSTNGMFDAGQFVTDGMGRIEILRGPQSLNQKAV
ncbi:hypothetical protein GLUCORHAEAF1_19090 [Komagataeibacter rhaeticus AF1]|nr:hypothetical protein GLUCORHAEAF1_19090 [Komagataeibacter rhaeticus AF1]